MVGVDETGTPVVCPLILVQARVKARLARPVAGRRIVGGPRIRDGVKVFDVPDSARRRG